MCNLHGWLIFRLQWSLASSSSWIRPISLINSGFFLFVCSKYLRKASAKLQVSNDSAIQATLTTMQGRQFQVQIVRSLFRLVVFLAGHFLRVQYVLSFAKQAPPANF